MKTWKEKAGEDCICDFCGKVISKGEIAVIHGAKRFFLPPLIDKIICSSCDEERKKRTDELSARIAKGIMEHPENWD